MVGNVFGFGPMGLPQQPAKPEDRRATIDKLATDTQIPANVLMALEEAGEPAETAAGRLSNEIKAGKRVEDVVDPKTMNRAYDIADALYPDPDAKPAEPKAESGAVMDTVKQLGGSLVSGIGSVGEAVGAAADIYADGGVKLDPKPSLVGDAARAAGGAVKSVGDDIKGSVSEAGKAAMEGSMPDGDLLDPSTWTKGENPSLRGYTMLASDVLGSFLPVVATAVITKNPALAAGVGGAQGGGAAVETARDTILKLEQTPSPDGGTMLERESAYFRELLGQGVPRDEAIRRTSQAAEKVAMLLTVPVSTFGGAATGKILGPGVSALAGKGLGVRAFGTGLLSAVEEGVQEAAETAATRTGINAGAESDLNVTDGTFGDFILGALGGGVPGAAAGALQEKTGGDGSAPGPAAVPGDGLSPPVGAGPGAAAPDMPLAPRGPISTISGLAPDLTPVPEPEPPAPKFPDFKPGKAVRLADPETGIIHDAVFLNETPDGVMVRIAGGEFEIDRKTFDASRLGAIRADEKAAGKKPDPLKLENPLPPTLRLENPLPPTLRLENPLQPTLVLDQFTPEEALRQAKLLEGRAAKGGWTRPMKEKHAKLVAIAGGANGTKETGPAPGKAQPDDSSGLAGAAASPDQVGSGRDADLVAISDDATAPQPGPGVSVGAVRADEAADADGAVAPKAAPITTTPDQRVQPDMLGGDATTEAAMASKEARRKEWGRFLDIAESGKSADDSMLEGREVRIRGTKIRILAENGKPSDQDYRLDTDGLDRDQIAAAVRGALNELDRRSPLPAPQRVEADAGTPAAAVRDSAAAGDGPKKAEAPKAEDHRDLNFEDTGGQFANKRVYPGFVVARSGSGFKVTREGETTPVVTAANMDQVRDLMRSFKNPYTGEAFVADANAEPAPSPKAGGPLSSLSAEKQARAAELKKRLADKVRNQLSSGLDPEYITLGGELVALYIEDGIKRFAQMLADFAESTGLTMNQAQEPLRAAYNHVRDNMELAGEDITGMDDARAVLEEARKAIQSEEAKPAETAKPVADKAKPEPTAQPVQGAVKNKPPVAKPIPATVRHGSTGPETGALDTFTPEVAYAFARDYMEWGARTGGMSNHMNWGYEVIEPIVFSFDQWFGPGARVKQPEGKVFVRGPRALDAYWFNVADIDAIIAKEGKAKKPDFPRQKTEEPKPEARKDTRPTGKTYRLENALTPAERRLIGASRDQYVGEVFAELDNAARRANADLMSRDLDIDMFDADGAINQRVDQMAWFIREAEEHARDLVKQVKADGAENVGPLAKDEDTGDWEYDDTALSSALEFLDQQYAMGLGVDEDVTPGPGIDDATDLEPMDEALVFPVPKGTKNLDAIANREGFIPMDEAAARLQFWKDTAREIGSTTKNRNKVILSLFDYKGTWSQPWRDAGYTVIQHDIKTGSDLLRDSWIYERITEIREEGKEVYGLLSACPCTTFTGSGARWWQERHDVESREALAQVFGDMAFTSGAKSALEYNVMLVDASREAVRLAKPTGFHVLENPIGRIQDKAKMPDPLARFHPHNFGDPYTKRTQLFGDFKPDLPLANVDPVEGSKMQNKLRGSDPLGKEDRSTTPEGFAYAFFMANDPDARKVKDQAPEITVGPAPAPETAPWWDTADDLTRRAILDAAEMSPRTTVARSFQDMPERARKMLTDAFGRLYRDGKIENIGTVEAPRFALTGETIDAVAVKPAVDRPTPENFPFADSAAGGPGPKARAWLNAASDETILATPDMGLSENWLRAERQRRKIGDYAEKPAPTAAEVKAAAAETDLALNGGDKGALSVKPMFDQKAEDGILSYAEVLGDSQAAKTLRSETFENLSRNAQGMVLAHVVGRLDDKKVFRAVVQAIPVDVMDVLIGQKITPQRLAGNPSMLTGRLAVPRDVAIPQPVGIFINELVAAAKSGLAIPRAKDSGLNAGAGIVDLPADGNAAGSAVSGDYWHGEFLGSSGSVHINASAKQKEAENYQVISADWRGLTLSLESPKGTMRRGYDENGAVTWQVVMPAHYGRILGTTGADGDHVDFYMGDFPESEKVYVIDQRDADTGEFDEHKVMLGFANRKTALDFYVQGFSDGKGADRLGAHKIMTVPEFKDWLENGDTTAPVRLEQGATNGEPDVEASAPDQVEDVTEDAAAAEKPASSSTKIEDFGEKLEGARKDIWATYSDQMKAADDVDVSAEPLSKSWPAPDYEKLIETGIDPWTVAFIRVARDAVPTKPQKSWRLKGWVDQVKILRGLASSLTDGTIDKVAVQQRLEQAGGTYAGILDAVALYEVAGHAQSLKGLSLGRSEYSVLGGAYHPTPVVRWEVSQKVVATAFSNMPRVIASGATKEEAIAAFKDKLGRLEQDQKKARTGAKFLIYSQRGETGKKYRIGVKIRSEYVDLRTGIENVQEARRIIAEESDALQAQLDQMRKPPNERRESNSPRVGVDHRNGADVTPEQFGETFGFRGVQFGNWVEGDRRQSDLNEAYDALMDMAGILDLPPKAISLNGSLGLAFGARGKGGARAAAAHFEPGQMVINLTKARGAGSLAHEWFHAADNYFSRRRTGKGSQTGYITDNRLPSSQVEGLRPELMDAFAAVRRAIAETELKARSQNLDKLRSSPYWSTGIEMHARAFESYVIAKLQDQSAANDYLANIVDGVAWQMKAELSGQGESYPYLTAEEIEKVRPAFDRLFQTIETRETDSGTEMFMREAPREPVATLTGDELGPWDDIRQLGKKAEAWYRDNLTGKTVIMESTGWKVQFGRVGSKKLGGRKGDVLLRLVPGLEQIIRGSDLLSSIQGRKPGTEQQTFHKVTARVQVAGENHDIVATLREDANGTFHYDLSMAQEAEADMQETGRVAEARSLPQRRLGIGNMPDTGAEINEVPNGKGDGARLMMAAGRDGDTAIGLEDNPVVLNMDLLAGTYEPVEKPVDDYALRILTKDLNADLAAHGLTDKITVRAVRQVILASGVATDGLGVFESRQRAIQVRTGGKTDTRGVMRHEIIHALRDANTWGKSHGLFTEAEWRALERAAHADVEIRNSVIARYSDLDAEEQLEEMVAELYRLWADGRDEAGTVGKALERVLQFFEAIANLLRGRGFLSAGRIMEEIANGTIGGAGPTPSGPGGISAGRVVPAEMRAGGLMPSGARRKFKDLLGSAHWKDPGAFLSSKMTDRITAGDWSLLGLVPGRALFSELGKKLPAAKTFLSIKDGMDAERNDRHAKAAEIANEWYEVGQKDQAARDELHDIMHRSTLSGVDPSKPDTWKHAMGAAANEAISRHGQNAPQWAFDVIEQVAARQRSYAVLQERFSALPKDMQALFRKVRREYDSLGEAFEKAVTDNIEASMKIALKRAERAYQKEVDRIRDEGLEGEEKDAELAAAKETLDAVKKRGGFTVKAKISSLRKVFESNRLEGPYFPLWRTGNYFVTVRDKNGKVTSFSRFEKEAQQQAFIREQKEAGQANVQFGLMSEADKLKSQVDPTFIADIEGLLADAGASEQVMDQIWQRWLETLPDQSIRTSKIHRKGREGWNKDALRAFSSHMFHGIHQLVRLKNGIHLQEALDEAKEQAKVADDPNRTMAIVNEMAKRLDWINNPTGSPWASWASSFTFVWYLGVSPAAALVNLSQTTVIAPALMKAKYRSASVPGILKELGRAAKDFGKGRGTAIWDTWSVENSSALSGAEKAAMKEGYRRGVIDKTQAHDLASVAESGVEFSPFREKWMRRIGWGFHHTERANREITFLAAYRLAKAEGMADEDAINSAADMTWQTHFSYQNSDRIRLMQKDWQKVIFGFKQYSVNLIWRLFRDAHQSLKGATKEERAEARTQLIGITLSMFAHAGIKGVWGYGIIMTLLGLFFPGDEDDIEEWLQDALLMEGDSPGVAAWNFAAGTALNGVLGHILGADLTERIGAPNLIFRGDDRDVDNEDRVQGYINEVLGPTIGTLLAWGRAADTAASGDIVRGIEQAAPKFVRDVLKAGRYAAEGVQTKNGDDLIENVNPWEILLQANGFTPARVAERYDQNTFLKNREQEVMNERKDLHREITDMLREGEPVSEGAMEKIRDFNRRYPDYPITAESIKQSLQGRLRASARNEGGVSLNPKLNDQLRGELAPAVY